MNSYWVYDYPAYNSYSKAWIRCDAKYYAFAKATGMRVAKGKQNA